MIRRALQVQILTGVQSSDKDEDPTEDVEP